MLLAKVLESIIMDIVFLWSLILIIFLAGILLIYIGWKKYKDEPERFQIWHITTSENNRNHGINFILLVFFEIFISFILFYMFFIHKH